MRSHIFYIFIFLLFFFKANIYALKSSSVNLTYPDKASVFQVQISAMSDKKDDFPFGKVFTLKSHFSNLLNMQKKLNIDKMEFDARMPDHNHGMITSAKVTKLSAQNFKVEGVKFHMKGYWELIFSIWLKNGERHKLVVPYEIK